jgi:hypothetical protein
MNMWKQTDFLTSSVGRREAPVNLSTLSVGLQPQKVQFAVKTGHDQPVTGQFDIGHPIAVGRLVFINTLQFKLEC